MLVLPTGPSLVCAGSGSGRKTRAVEPCLEEQGLEPSPSRLDLSLIATASGAEYQVLTRLRRDQRAVPSELAPVLTSCQGQTMTDNDQSTTGNVAANRELHPQCDDQPRGCDASPSSDTDPSTSSLSLAIEQAIAEGSHYSEVGHTVAAEQAYMRADHLLGSERGPRHVEVLVRLAMLLRRRGDLGQASSHLDMALAMFPGHRAALSLRLSMAEEQQELATAAALRIRMVDLCESTEARVHVLSAAVEDALSAAISAALRAVELRPSDADLRHRLSLLLDAS
jgi:hypothetical protein